VRAYWTGVLLFQFRVTHLTAPATHLNTFAVCPETALHCIIARMVTPYGTLTTQTHRSAPRKGLRASLKSLQLSAPGQLYVILRFPAGARFLVSPATTLQNDYRHRDLKNPVFPFIIIFGPNRTCPIMDSEIRKTPEIYSNLPGGFGRSVFPPLPPQPYIPIMDTEI
jgi:hypothetical protein